MKRLAIILLLVVTPAHAQTSRTIYGSDGRVEARTSTGTNGATTIFDARGRVTGRTATDSQGTTTIYDAAGHKAGTVTKPK